MVCECCYYSVIQTPLSESLPSRFEPDLEHELSLSEKKLRNRGPQAGGLADQAGENVATPVQSCLCRLFPGALMLSAFLAVCLVDGWLMSCNYNYLWQKTVGCKGWWGWGWGRQRGLMSSIKKCFYKNEEVSFNTVRSNGVCVNTFLGQRVVLFCVFFFSP